VLLKPVRSYVHLRLGPAGRFDVLRGHYQLFRQLFSHECVQRQGELAIFLVKRGVEDPFSRLSLAFAHAKAADAKALG
jgi:hypothetical protein